MKDFCLNKSNNMNWVYTYKLWWCLALGMTVFAFGCKQANDIKEPKLTISDEITINVKGDESVIVKNPNIIKIKKSLNLKWKEIKTLAEAKITLKENQKIKEWRVNNEKGLVLKDTDAFEKDTVVFVISKEEGKPVPPTKLIKITVEVDSGYTFKEAIKPCTIEAQKGSAWSSIKAKAEAKIELKDGYEKIGWKLGGKDGGYLKDSFVFNRDEIVYASSKINGSAEIEKVEILVCGDDGVLIEGDDTFNVDKGAKWKAIRAQATAKVTIRENFQLKEWRIKTSTGTLLGDETKFEKNTSIFAVSEPKDTPEIPSQLITITIEADEGYIFKDATKPCTIQVKKGIRWEVCKEKIKTKIELKKKYQEFSWKLGGVNGTYVLPYQTKLEQDITVFAVSMRKWVNYKVEYWRENIEDDEYTKIKEEYKQGFVDELTEEQAKPCNGFEALEIVQQIISEDGTTVVKVKYRRKIVSLVIDLDGGKYPTQLEDGIVGKKLLKGKFGHKLNILEPTKQNFRFIKWEPKPPIRFPANDNATVYLAKWEAKMSYRVNIKGDERVEISEPKYIDVSIGSSKKLEDIKDEIKQKVSLKFGWSNEYYEFYDWRMDGEEGEKVDYNTQIIDDMTIYVRTNYTKFKLIGAELQGYNGEQPKGRIILPKEVEVIKLGCFQGCYNLTNVDLSPCSNLNEIESSAFFNCTKLKSVNLKNCNKITSIGNHAFYCCSNFEGIDLSACTKLNKIGIYAFYGCSTLKFVNLSNCVELTSIENNVFSGCTSLKVLNLNNCAEIAFIGDDTFTNCTRIERIDLSACTKLQTIGSSAFLYCSGLKRINLSNCHNITNIGASAFNGCSNLEVVDLSPCIELKIIGGGAFKECSRLKNINLNNCTNIKYIGGNAFTGCVSLEIIDLSTCVKLKRLEENTFQSCPNAKVKLPASIEEIEDMAFGINIFNFPYCWKENLAPKSVLVASEEIKRLVIGSGYPDDKIKMY